MYIGYECQVCGAEFVMLTDQLKQREIEGRYIACPFGHKNIDVLGRYDDIKECMDNRKYKRVGGRIKQME